MAVDADERAGAHSSDSVVSVDGERAQLETALRQLCGELLAVVDRHAGIVVALVLSVMVTARIWKVSGGDTVTMQTLVGVTPPVDILIGTIGPGVAFLVWTCCIGLALYYAALILSGRRLPTRRKAIVIVAVAVVSVVFAWFGELTWAPNWLVVAPWGTTVVLLYFERSLRRGAGFLRRSRVVKRAFDFAARQGANLSLSLFLVVIIALFGSIATDRPWMPSERLTLNDGAVMVGYVIGRDDADLLVLVEDGRVVERIDESEVSARELCSLDEHPDPDRYRPCMPPANRHS